MEATGVKIGIALIRKTGDVPKNDERLKLDAVMKSEDGKNLDVVTKRDDGKKIVAEIKKSGIEIIEMTEIATTEIEATAGITGTGMVEIETMTEETEIIEIIETTDAATSRYVKH